MHSAFGPLTGNVDELLLLAVAIGGGGNFKRRSMCLKTATFSEIQNVTNATITCENMMVKISRAKSASRPAIIHAMPINKDANFRNC